jgi:hypothetical protein
MLYLVERKNSKIPFEQDLCLAVVCAKNKTDARKQVVKLHKKIFKDVQYKERAKWLSKKYTKCKQIDDIKKNGIVASFSINFGCLWM